MIDLLTNLDPSTDVEALKEDFAGKRGVITRLRTILTFVEKYQSNEDIINELKNEMEYLIANILGEDSAGISF
jgi:hypothetical protein